MVSDSEGERGETRETKRVGVGVGLGAQVKQRTAPSPAESFGLLVSLFTGKLKLCVWGTYHNKK